MDHETYIRMVETTREPGFVEVELQIGPKNHRLCFRSADLPLTGNPEALISLALLPAMKEGGALNAEGQVSQRFLNALQTIQDIYSAWSPSLHRIEIKKALPAVKGPSAEGRVGTFFSGVSILSIPS